MRCLVIGGSVFVGRHIVEALLQKGHDVTVFHRGNTPIPESWEVDEVLGDRDGGLDALAGKDWDVAIDCCGYVPRLVRASCEALKDSVKRYLFISTVSVYSDAQLNVVVPEPAVDTEAVNAQTYGPLKVECEVAVRAVFGDKATIVRPGLVAGPYDPTCRFDHWVDKFSRYKTVLVPQNPDSPLQLIDARDLADFVLILVEANEPGTFDTVGATITFGEMIKALRAHSRAEVVLANVRWLESSNREISRDFPFSKIDDPTFQAVMRIYPRASLQRGLRRRPLEETIRDTMAWTMGLAAPRVSERSGLPRSEEEAMIAELVATRA